MRALWVVAIALLFTVVACGRTSLRTHPFANGGNSANQDAEGTGAAGGVTSGLGGQAGHSTGGVGGVRQGSGGVIGVGGASTISSTTRTGGAVGTGGAGGTVGHGGAATGGSSRTGGAIATGGTAGAGGASPSGGRSGSGGGSGGAIHTGGSSGTGGKISSGGTIGHGGAASGGAVSSGGASGGATGRGGTTGTGGSCGDGVIGPGEQCDLGADNQDSPAFWVTQGDLGFAVVPVVRDSTVADFYSYSSSSGHTGFEAAGTGRIFLFLEKSTHALSLVVFHGIDQDSTGVEQPTSKVVMQFTGLPDNASVEVSDDSDELWMISATAATGFWKFTNNTDGGALSGLPFPGSWEITVAPSFIDGISVWTWVKSDGSFVNLDLTQPLTIRASSFPSLCRANCTIPACGDGILDAGEICDEGALPPPGGKGCHCMSFD